MWSQIVGDGIAKALERERYCAEGALNVIDFVNNEFRAATDALKAANDAHDEVMGYNRRRAVASTVVTVTKKKRKKAAA